MGIEESEIKVVAHELVTTYGSTAAIPAEELRQRGYSRYIANNRANLFKKLRSGKGYVTYKDTSLR